MTPEKREFMIKVTRIIATNSYLAEHMKGEMPEEVKNLLMSGKRLEPAGHIIETGRKKSRIKVNT